MPEPERPSVNRAMAEAIPAISRLSVVEVSSAIERRFREQSLSASARSAMSRQLQADIPGFLVVELDPQLAEAASALLQRHSLRAADAIQLASALRIRDDVGPMSAVHFFAFDRALDQAATDEGFSLPPMVEPLPPSRRP